MNRPDIGRGQRPQLAFRSRGRVAYRAASMVPPTPTASSGVSARSSRSVSPDITAPRRPGSSRAVSPDITEGHTLNREVYTNAESEDESSDEDIAESGAESASDSDDEIGTGGTVRSGMPRTSSSEWRRDKDYTPTLHDFDSSNSGISAASGLNSASHELDFFLALFPQQLLDLIVTETNRYYDALVQGVELEPNSKLRNWTPTDSDEILRYLATVLLMSQVRKHTIPSYWTTDSLIKTPMFSEIMTGARFKLIHRLLHFSGNSVQAPGNRLSKISPVVDILRESYRNTMQPFESLCIDESLVLYKGRLCFKQYIPMKRHRFGIKLFVLCDCDTGYILDFFVYEGSSTVLDFEASRLGYEAAVVMTLLKPYLGKGHNLYVDNWYTSPALFRELFANKTNACGTVKSNRKEMPTFTQKLKVGGVESYNTDYLLAFKWKDKREVGMLTSLHPRGSAPTGKKDKAGNDIRKPIAIIQYNEHMGAVDKSDMMISFTECSRRSVKWYKKLFFHLIDTTVLNAHILYGMTFGTNLELPDFQRELVRQMLSMVAGRSSRPPSAGAPDHPLRLVDRHFPTEIPGGKRLRCYVCWNGPKKQEKKTYFCCQICGHNLCVTPCFEIFHTKDDPLQ